MRWLLIRHGQTQGNREHRYIGCRTDEPLCPEGIAALQGKTYPPAAKVYVSPLRRCQETAALLYPGVPAEIVDDFRECDFGDFENQNYAELNGNADYQAWIDSGGERPFPHGESRAQFAARCVSAFESIREQAEDCAIIAHGGTVMAIMEKYARPQGTYFDFQVKNGCGFTLFADGSYEPIQKP
ncbi:MAG: histidine phosphatase family protein [Clostridiales bacterium]|nr:histidine phosphatase family protein [Clostridiales bacterium]